MFHETNMAADHVSAYTLYLFVLQKEHKGLEITCAYKTANSLLNSLAFQAPPQLNPELRNQSVAFNSTLNLSCVARGDRPLWINWTKNGMDLGNRDNNTYTVFQMTLDHTGFYGCAAKNWAGKAYTFFWIDVTGKALSCESEY